ncbi:MAG: CapA family protein [Candidatus Paceibacterota bacterium]
MVNLRARRTLFVLPAIVLFAVGFYYFDTVVAFGEEIVFNVTHPAGTATVEEKGKKGIVFVGDIMLARSVEKSLLSLPAEHAFLGVKELFKDTFVVGNFEASVPTVHEPTPNFTFKFSVTPRLLPILTEAGVTHLSLANNHALDYGAAGYRNTVMELRRHELTAFGHPILVSSSSISYIELDNKKVAVIAVSNLFTKPSVTEWEPVISEANRSSDLQVVYIHWGNEYELIHSEKQRKFAKELIDAGVDIVVGHHPHVVQDIWRYGDGVVFYSLGNFIFDQYWKDDVLNGLALDMSFEEHIGWQIRLVPVESKSVRLQPREMVGEEREAFLVGLADRSDPGLADGIMAGVISLQF